jgi:hypothetical protein
MAKTLYGINEEMERCVKLQVLYPNISRAEPAGVEELFLEERKRKLNSKLITNSSLNILIVF